ncbi:MAG: acyl-CoA thioesterase [Selenomonadaceae bacterium]|nr:acyl-CoA thioesterase [Selenomonadaceae bacterium]MBR3722111.1 acyl-CoA thioesterase [Selenomonadaceae bacterium]
MPVNAKIRVNFYDTDAMAVVHHANYIRWFEIGRVEYLRSIGITLGDLMEDGFVFPITEVSAKFVSPGYYDDDLIIETTATELTKVKMAFNYKVYREKDGTLLVTGHTQNVYTSRETGKITRLTEKYHKKLEEAIKKERDENGAG